MVSALAFFDCRGILNGCDDEGSKFCKFVILADVVGAFALSADRRGILNGCGGDDGGTLLSAAIFGNSSLFAGRALGAGITAVDSSSSSSSAADAIFPS